MEWEQRWTRINNRESARGSQGTIDLVSNKITGENGALKPLHERFMHSREYRGRMVREVIALKAVAGTGVGGILYSVSIASMTGIGSVFRHDDLIVGAL